MVFAGRLQFPPIEVRRISRWLQPVALGALSGGAISIAASLGGVSLSQFATPLQQSVEYLDRSIGPVWIAMLAVSLRVAWLGARAFGTRFGRGANGLPVRPELGQLAPLFAALGLCGTVWGLSRAFGALEADDFLTQLPGLLGGLGAAMTSTLVGLTLQIATLLLAAFNPTWSSVRVSRTPARAADSPGPDAVHFALDGSEFGCGVAGFAALAEALRARQPEALQLWFARGIDGELRERVRLELWRRIDGDTPLRVSGESATRARAIR